MKKINQYKKQIVTFVTIFLLTTYGIFPALTAANTFLNIVGGIGALLLLIWGGFALYDGLDNPHPIQSVDGTITQSPKPKTKPKTKRKPKVKNPEYPLPPHHPISKTTKTK